MNEAELGKIMSGVAHDLRTPLTVISGFAKTLERGGGLDDRQVRFLGLIFDAATDMDRMIENVSTIGHVVSGRWAPQLEAISRSELVTEAVAAVVQREGRPILQGTGPDGVVTTDRLSAARAIALLAEAALRLEPSCPSATIAAHENGVRVAPFGAALFPFILAPGRDVPIEAARLVLERLGAAITADGDDGVVVRFGVDAAPA